MWVRIGSFFIILLHNSELREPSEVRDPKCLSEVLVLEKKSYHLLKFSDIRGACIRGGVDVRICGRFEVRVRRSEVRRTVTRWIPSVVTFGNGLLCLFIFQWDLHRWLNIDLRLRFVPEVMWRLRFQKWPPIYRGQVIFPFQFHLVRENLLIWVFRSSLRHPKLVGSVWSEAFWLKYPRQLPSIQPSSVNK